MRLTNRLSGNNRCEHCGYEVKEAEERYTDFQTEAAEEIYCPECGHQKHFGVIHGE